MIATPLIALLSLTATAAAPVDFDTQIVPVLTRAGCNSGACHGSAIGRGGFKLSLWGQRPADDYTAIVHQLEGRRVNLARPEASLLLLKPTGLLDHEGGYLLDESGPGVQRISAWLSQGAQRLERRTLISFDVEPRQAVLPSSGGHVHLAATAHFDDGTHEDVTGWAVFTPLDPAAVAMDETGLAHVRAAGQNIVTVRFLDRLVAVELVVPLADEPIDLSHAPRLNFIDEEINAVLEIMRLPAAPPADDATFLRRASLDLTGAQPTPDDVRAFLSDETPDKRLLLIDRLLASDEYVDYWTYRWATLFQINSRSMNREGALAFHGWLRGAVAAGTPWNEVVRELLTASGDSFEIGPANFARAAPDARQQAEHVSRALLGARLGCANCHDHPLDRWTQDDYHGLAAVFARLERGRQVRLAERGEVTHPVTGQPAVPRLPGVRYLVASDDDPRDDFADWLTAPDNPHFARAVVNRLWQAMFGRGLVEPVDDLRATNPATHPRLLDRLAADFVDHGYDVRHTLRRIATSAAYGRGETVAAHRSDDRFYSHARPRPHSAEVMADAIAAVTGVADTYGDLPAGTRAVALYDSLIEAPGLDVLGRCSRTEPCDASAGATAGLARRLHLINGELLNRKITDPDGRLRQLLAAGAVDDEIVETFYLRALGRYPTETENRYWRDQFQAAGDHEERRQRCEDFLWSLLVCREFATNH